jgi:hypothetical protein
MKKLSNKSKATLLALLLVMTLEIPMMALPLVTAHTPPLDIPTYSYLAVYQLPQASTNQ